MECGKLNIQTLMVAGFEPALKGMRNPMNSWDKSDSLLHNGDGLLLIGKDDMKLAQNLILAGTEHGKFLRMIQVWFDVTMPRYWWSEADTYGFSTKNSCSTMHKIASKPIDMQDFYWGEKMTPETINTMFDVIDRLNQLRLLYLETKDFQYVMEMKRILPETYLQTRTWNTSYQQIRNMWFQRRMHRQVEEWQNTFCKWVESLPYAQELILLDKYSKM